MPLGNYEKLIYILSPICHIHYYIGFFLRRWEDFLPLVSMTVQQSDVFSGSLCLPCLTTSAHKLVFSQIAQIV